MAQNYKKYCIYAIDDSKKLSFFIIKNSLEFLFEGDELFVWAICCMFLQILIDILDKWYAGFHMRSVVVKIECFFLFVGHLFF